MRSGSSHRPGNLARYFECPLVTFDERLARASAQLGVTATVPGAH